MKLIYMLLAILLSINGYTQNQSTDNFSLKYNFAKDPILKGKIDFVLGYSGLKNNFIEVGIAKGYRGYEGWAYVYSAYYLTTEFTTFNSNLIIAPKIGYSTSIAFLNMGIYGLYYVDTKTSNGSFFVRPEIGPTFFGIATLFYGYNIGKNFSNSINQHNIGVKLTLGKGSL